MTPLLGPRTLERLARLDLGAARAAGGAPGGERLAGGAGTGTLFREHRTYAPGDDLRYVDWNAFGRLRSLHVKVFEREESVDVHLLLDRSASMGAGPGSKLETALRVAGLVGAVGLARNAVVRLQPVPAPEGADDGPRAYRGRGGTGPLLDALRRVPGGARAPLGRALRPAFPRLRRRGLALLVSDFLDEGDEPADGWRRAVDFLRHRRVRLVAVHVVAPEERDPPVDGPLRLVDAESGDELALDFDASARERYRARFAAHLREVGAYLRRREASHVVVDAGRDDAALLRTLLAAGVLR